MTTTTEPFPQLEDVWPLARREPVNQPPRFDEIREFDDLLDIRLYDGRSVALATGYDVVREIIMNPNVSSDPTDPGFPSISDATKVGRSSRKAFDRMDPPRHDKHRRMLASAFTIKKIRELQPFIEKLVDDLLDRMEERGGPIDLVADFAEPIPAIAIAEILGLPHEDGEFFHDRIKKWMSEESTPAEIAQANTDILDYFERVVDERVAAPAAGDLLSRLVHERHLTGELSRAELLAMCHLLVAAGFDTSANMIALSTYVLLRDGKWQELVDADPDFVSDAMEELLRYVSVAHFAVTRIAADDVEAGGRVIPKGKPIIASVAAANHDPRKYPDPHTIDLRRPARDHLAFGLGLHQCLGQPLARMELRAVFERLPKRFPGLRLAVPVETLHFRESLVYGVETLPVTW